MAADDRPSDPQQPLSARAPEGALRQGGVRATVHARARDLGGFSVRRILPSARTRRVGPFVFLDHMGPVRFDPGHAIDVRPHPHINLATVTYLFEGEILHRDSLGFEQAIQPGAVNLMFAGHGIVHSERTRPELKTAGQALHGIQLWLGLPLADEERDPSFHHYPAAQIPRKAELGAELSVILGSAYGLTSPVLLPMETLYVAVSLEQGASVLLPECEERAIYVVQGEVRCEAQQAIEGDMLVFEAGAPIRVEALEAARFVILGGAALEGERHLWWNFVSSRPERIERAKSDWKEGRFASVPGDESEFIPLPE